MIETAYDIEQKNGESLEAWHQRRANFQRKQHITFQSTVVCETNCMLCWFNSQTIGMLHIESDHGKVFGHVCAKCLKRLIDGCERVIEQQLRWKAKA